MRYRITHRTAYDYTAPAHESFNEVRLRPVSDEAQTCLTFDLAIDPPATVIVFRDYYGNAVHDFGVPYLHDHLCVEATSDVVTFAGADEPVGGPPMADADRSPPIAGLAADPDFADEHAEFLIPSAYVVLDDATAELTRSLRAAEPGGTAYAFLRAAAAWVHDRLVYQVGATTVHSTVAEVLAGGSGVCQDFSHLLISLCRHAGLPARYVSGYLGDVGESTASHAWAEAFVPPYGWLGVDPTAGAPCTGRHVKVAVGRDYADVSVVRGTYRGGAASGLEVTVRSEVIGDARGLAVSANRGRGELVQYQTLGAMKQLQRLGPMTQSLGSMSQTLGTMTQTLGDAPPGLPDHAGEGAPRQQPQQQQQQQTPRSAGAGALLATAAHPIPPPRRGRDRSIGWLTDTDGTALAQRAGRSSRRTRGAVMRLHVGCEFGYESPTPTPAVVLVEPHRLPEHRVVWERWEIEPATELHGYRDLLANRCQRLVLPTGPCTLVYDAEVEVSGEPDPVAPETPQLAVEELPDDVLVFTLASRYCPTESLSQVAWHLFGGSAPGWGRVQAVCDWIHDNIQYGILKSTPLTTAVDVYVAGGGMCRDFAHLAVTFCRALNIPARYVFGYMPDIGVPGPFPPMDFHAWFEVYLGDRWWTFDARFNTPRIGRIPIGIGRDAVDVAMVTTYGAAAFRRMVVWTDEVVDAAANGNAEGHRSESPEDSEALVLEHGEARAAS